MKKITLTRYDLKNNFLIMDCEAEKDFEPTMIHLTDRESKLSIELEFLLEQNGNLASIKFDLSKIPYKKDERNILDVFLVNQDGTLYRPMYTDIPSDQDESRYLSEVFAVNYKTSVVPYLTKKGELSILYGDSLRITNAFAKTYSSKITAIELNFTGSKAFITFPRYVNQNLDFKEFFVTLVDRKHKKKSIILPYEIIETSIDNIKLEVNLNINFSKDHRYDLYIEQKIKHSIIKRRVGIAFPGQMSHQQVFYKPIQTSIETIVPYLTTNGELTFWGYNKISSLPINRLDVDTEGNLKVMLSDNVINQFLDNRVKLYLRNKKHKGEILFTGTIELSEDSILTLTNKSMIATFQNINAMSDYELIARFETFPDQDVVILPTDDESIQEDTFLSNVFKFKLETAWIAENKFRTFSPFKLKDSQLLVPFLSEMNILEFRIETEESFKQFAYESIPVNFDLKDIKINNSALRLLFNETVHHAHQITLGFTARGKKEVYEYDLNLDQEGYLVCVLDDFIASAISEDSRWDIYLKVLQGDLILKGKVGLLSQSLKPKHQRYFPAITNQVITDTNNVLGFYLTNKNYLSCVIKPYNKLLSEKYESKIQLVTFDMKKNHVTIGVNLTMVDLADFAIDSLKLVLRGSGESLEYKINPIRTDKLENGVYIQTVINVNAFEFQPFYWDLYIAVQAGTEIVNIRVKNPTSNVKVDINKHLIKNQYNFTNGYIIYPYITVNKELSFTYRPEEKYETNWHKIKEDLAYYTYRLFKKYFDKKDIWIGFEKFSQTAQDNGYYFFKYCYENNKHKNYFYVIDKDSKDFKTLAKQKDRVLKLKSFKHMVYTYAAKLFIASELKVHSVNIRVQKGRLKNALDRKKIVFLQHGVFGLKQAHTGGLNKTKNNAVDLFVVSSDYERTIIKDYFNYKNNEIIVTGLARWDVLEDKSQQVEKKEIFVMPTWRTWLEGMTQEEFLATDYYKHYFGLLTSERLQKMVSDHNIQLSFFIHPKFKEYIGNFEIDNPDINIYQFGDIKVNQKIMESSILVTDYSSIAWDMFYMSKPVLFYQFDIDEYNQYEGSYINMETELFGDRAFTVDGMVDLIDEYIQRDFTEKEKFKPYRAKHIKYHDRQNSERIFKEIKKHKKVLYKK
ncbi:CDP-glycerol glycerophosphotransferase family protein [Bacillus sp. USDA818B3_A]|uniref:CDP-glycerol glycerophosphotransferase family protein n=1 Tax=Bacillus sp. USDA818B3_A TaxID=2698834 RepID=UPI00136C78D0|nr:CDP-glycerol glycerophosphotransferase family protein [Bacillus sp. USDA818B3_A]